MNNRKSALYYATHAIPYHSKFRRAINRIGEDSEIVRGKSLNQPPGENVKEKQEQARIMQAIIEK